jgi:hypothetical protein
MSRIHLVVGDTRPQVYVQLSQPDVPLDEPVDLSGATVFLKFRAWDEDVVLFQMTGELLPGTLQADLKGVDLTEYPTPGSGGRVRFSFLQGQLNLAPGRYRGEIEVNYGPGSAFTAFAPVDFELREAFG